MRQAFTLASPFIVSCPSSNPNLNLTPFPSLNIDGAFPTNQTAFPGLTANVQIAPNLTATHIAFFTGLKPIFVPIENGTVLLPQNVSGQVYAIATSSESDSSDDSTVAGPAIMLFERFTNESLTN
jgi:hypothetical protein